MQRRQAAGTTPKASSMAPPTPPVSLPLLQDPLAATHALHAQAAGSGFAWRAGSVCVLVKRGIGGRRWRMAVVESDFP